MQQRTGKRRSATLNHFEDKIDNVCVETARELVNASRCLAPANFDFHIKATSFVSVLKYYARELETFSKVWKGAVKQFTDNAQTYSDDPQGSAAFLETGSQVAQTPSSDEEAAAFKERNEKINAEMRKIFDRQLKPEEFDSRRYPEHTNKDQKYGFDVKRDGVTPRDPLEIDDLKPFPSHDANTQHRGSGTSYWRQKYDTIYNPVPDGEQDPAYADDKSAEAFNIEKYAQRYIFWRNEHLSAYNNLIFATGPYQASAKAYSAVLKQQGKQVEMQKTSALASFEGYYDSQQTKEIMNAIKLYQNRAGRMNPNLKIPSKISELFQSPLESCGRCDDRFDGKSPGVCLPADMFPCGPLEGLVNPYYIWNDEGEMWKRRFQLMDKIAVYFDSARLKIDGVDTTAGNWVRKFISELSPEKSTADALHTASAQHSYSKVGHANKGLKDISPNGGENYTNSMASTIADYNDDQQKRSLQGPGKHLNNNAYGETERSQRFEAEGLHDSTATHYPYDHTEGSEIIHEEGLPNKQRTDVRKVVKQQMEDIHNVDNYKFE
jgi:hypothetical protein